MEMVVPRCEFGGAGVGVFVIRRLRADARARLAGVAGRQVVPKETSTRWTDAQSEGAK